MEKIGFSEVGRGLLFIMCPCQADTAAGRKQETISVKHRTPGLAARGWGWGVGVDGGVVGCGGMLR